MAARDDDEAAAAPLAAAPPLTAPAEDDKAALTQSSGRSENTRLATSVRAKLRRPGKKGREKGWCRILDR